MVRGSILVATAVVSASAMKCPGSKAWLGHAKTQVTATADASCADVKAEITARAHGGWTDPHNGGIYSVLSSSATEVETKRTANPSHSVGGQTYTDKQIFTLTDAAGKCTIEACSESQGTSVKDFSTNYCDIRNLYCGKADGCKPVGHDFTSTQTKVDASSGQSDFSACIVKASEVAAALPTCPPKDFTSIQSFDLTAFVKTRWYIQQQMPVHYLPKSENRCVYAEYKVLNPKSILGYDIQVHNYAQDVAAPHKVHDSGTLICAAIVDAATGKLEVAPCFLPKAASGDYWVIAFDDSEGWALISGGPPTHAAAGGCRTGTGINGSGLWIFTRAQTRDDSIVDKVRGVAKAKGFDLSVLNDVDQTGCKYESATTVVV